MLDDFLPGVPDASTSTPIVADAFEYPVGLRFAFIGVGQAGGRIASAFYDQGYRRVCAVNTASADLSELGLPDAAKLVIGNGAGAGKDPHVAGRAAKAAEEDIYRLCDNAFGEAVDWVFVCFAAGGGTGCGAFGHVLGIVRRWIRDKQLSASTGVVVAFPKTSDGARSLENASLALQTLQDASTTVLPIDNERFMQLYGRRLPAAQEKPQSNAATVGLLHAFNRLAGTSSEDRGGTTFDTADFRRVLGAGVIGFARAKITSWATEDAVATELLKQMRANMLLQANLEGATAAALLYLPSEDAWSGQRPVTAGHLDSGARLLQRALSPSATVFTGVYPGLAKEGLDACVMIGGLPLPAAIATGSGSPTWT